jgi:4-diphosphocytidyl-2-C-methyl-D-erythritol kinase
MLTLHAPAKINLFLRILAQEKTGFHQLETLFASLEFGDTLALSSEAKGVTLHVDGPNLGPVEENLVFRAAEAFFRETGVKGGVQIRLKKRVPPGAGLGGGSSDAAATLLGLHGLFPGEAEKETLLGIAGSLGSDVPFFLADSPFALAWGRGERLFPVASLESAPVLLALPPLSVPTPWAYQALAQARSWETGPRGPRVLEPELLSSWEKLSSLVENDFQEIVFREHPLLSSIHEGLQRKGPMFSLLSGSGSALFAVFPDEVAARRAGDELSEDFPDTKFVLTRTRFSRI